MTREADFDLFAEQVTLGAAILSAEMASEIAVVLKADDFAEPRHVKIYTALTDIRDGGKPVDPVTVADLLLRRGQLGPAGGAAYIHTLVEAVPTVAHGMTYAKSVLRASAIRQLTKALTRAQDAIAAPGADPFQLQEQILASLSAIGGAESDQEGPRAWQDIVGPAFAALEQASSIDEEASAGIPTDILDLDRMLNGLKPGQLIVVGGRPGAGKSVIVDGNIVRAAAIARRLDTLVFSLEMTEGEIFQRLLSAVEKIPLHNIVSGKLDDNDWAGAASFLADTDDLRFWIDDTPGLSLPEIRTRSRRHRQRHGLDLVVVDYLQLITVKGAESRQQAVGAVARGLKDLAKELEVPIVAAAQLNRGPEGRLDRVPTMADLRESGDIEAAADAVILLHAPSDESRAGELDLVVAKNRNGPKGTVTVASQFHYARVVDLAII